ncbi:hypothetical protein CUP0959 [Campylobacter upsaliensis RM3195]|uniref:hypothetical protein n=1 Tax=Campylobacter upsaliensis TaxID=28080 RepID=UPI00004B357A|nr:hypothetical protein [Campylobacter upsaliensis]EAL52362.1 hypothetical protein CUP0959 [Campylobacter upsaliensis RM3195]
MESKFKGEAWQIRRIWAGRAFSFFTSNAGRFRNSSHGVRTLSLEKLLLAKIAIFALKRR